MNISACLTSKSDEWETPQDLFDSLNKKYHFTLDPCCQHYNAKCDKHYTREEDGLTKDWGGEVVFCNPPYGQEIGKWVRKCYEEHLNGTVIVMLIPSRTDTKWFHEYIYKKPNVHIEFLKGRLKFVNRLPSNWNEGGNSEGETDRPSKANSAPFPSMLVYFNTE